MNTILKKYFTFIFYIISVIFFTAITFSLKDFLMIYVKKIIYLFANNFRVVINFIIDIIFYFIICVQICHENYIYKNCMEKIIYIYFHKYNWVIKILI